MRRELKAVADAGYPLLHQELESHEERIESLSTRGWRATSSRSESHEERIESFLNSALLGSPKIFLNLMRRELKDDVVAYLERFVEIKRIS